MYNYERDINGNVWEKNSINPYEIRIIGYEIPSYSGPSQIINSYGNTIGHTTGNYGSTTLNINGFPGSSFNMNTPRF